MSARWIGMLDRLFRRVRCRCPACGNAVTVPVKRLDGVWTCDLCGGVFFPAEQTLDRRRVLSTHGSPQTGEAQPRPVGRHPSPTGSQTFCPSFDSHGTIGGLSRGRSSDS